MKRALAVLPDSLDQHVVVEGLGSASRRDVDDRRPVSIGTQRRQGGLLPFSAAQVDAEHVAEIPPLHVGGFSVRDSHRGVNSGMARASVAPGRVEECNRMCL